MPEELVTNADTHSGMPKFSRTVHGPRPIAAVVPGVTRIALKRAGLGIAQLVEAWAGIVGPTLATTTTPRRLAQGTLTIGCAGPVAMELQHLSTEVIGRINQYLGSQVVRRLRLTQMTAVPPTLRTRPRPTETVVMAAADAVADLPDGPLRAALAALGRAVLTESTSRLGKQPRTRY